MKVGDLVIYAATDVASLIGEYLDPEVYGVGLILDENPHYYFINWAGVISDSPMLAIPRDYVKPATIENVQQIREYNEWMKKNT